MAELGLVFIGIIIGWGMSVFLGKSKIDQILSDMQNIASQYPPGGDVDEAFRKLLKYIQEG